MRWLKVKEREPRFMADVILAFLRPSDDKPMVSLGFRESDSLEESSYYCYELRCHVEPTHWIEKPKHPYFIKEKIIED